MGVVLRNERRNYHRAIENSGFGLDPHEMGDAKPFLAGYAHRLLKARKSLQAYGQQNLLEAEVSSGRRSRFHSSLGIAYAVRAEKSMQSGREERSGAADCQGCFYGIPHVEDLAFITR
jgi:hypothetical protein